KALSSGVRSGYLVYNKISTPSNSLRTLLNGCQSFKELNPASKIVIHFTSPYSFLFLTSSTISTPSNSVSWYSLIASTIALVCLPPTIIHISYLSSSSSNISSIVPYPLSCSLSSLSSVVPLLRNKSSNVPSTSPSSSSTYSYSTGSFLSRCLSFTTFLSFSSFLTFPLAFRCCRNPSTKLSLSSYIFRNISASSKYCVCVILSLFLRLLSRSTSLSYSILFLSLRLSSFLSSLFIISSIS